MARVTVKKETGSETWSRFDALKRKEKLEELD